MTALKHIFVINRLAGGGLKSGFEDKIAAIAREVLGDFNAIYPKSADEAKGAVTEAIKNGIERVVVVGGDGSVNAAVNGFYENGELINRDAALVVADGGGACDYKSSLYGKDAPIDLKALLADGVIKKVDVGVTRFPGQNRAQHYFVNMLSAGMSAEVDRRRADGSRVLPVSLQYLFPTVALIFTYKSTDITVKIDEETYKHRAMVVTVAKGAYAGGGMKFGLDVTLDDGEFEVTVIEDSNRVYLAFNLLKLYSGNYLDVKGIVKYRCKNIRIHSAVKIGVEADGDPYQATEVDVSILPRSLGIIHVVS